MVHQLILEAAVALCCLSLLSVLSSLLQEVLLQVLQFPLSLKELCQEVYQIQTARAVTKLSETLK